MESLVIGLHVLRNPSKVLQLHLIYPDDRKYQSLSARFFSTVVCKIVDRYNTINNDVDQKRWMQVVFSKITQKRNRRYAE